MRAALVASLVLTAAAAAAGAAPPAPPIQQPSAAQSPSALCRTAIAAAERASGVPDRLMQAIGVVESGRPDERGGTTAWPWTINVEGAGYVFDTREQAIAAVAAHRARGARSIDVGCMQVNLLHHGDAFATIEEAFDPTANARYAAQFLLRLLQQTGSWPKAAAGYHSLTPDIGADYARKVLAVWARPNLGQATAAAQPTGPLPLAPSLASSLAPSLPPVTSGRVLPMTAGAASPVGRGLDAYRAAPTRLATAGALRRG